MTNIVSGPILILKSKLLVTAITNHDNQAYHDDNHDDDHDDNHDDNYDGDDDDDDDDDAGTAWCQECWWYSIPHDEWSAAPPMWKPRYGAVAVDLSGPSNNSKSGPGLRTV